MNQAVFQATKDHCKFCFEVLIAKLVELPPPPFPKAIANITAPLFVTWSTAKDDELRGCIGTFEPRPLSASLRQFALKSALKDPRFPPISVEEVEELKVEVSLLGNFKEQSSHHHAWEVGRHGVILTFKKGYHTYNGTFLPEIAAEEGWTRQETLVHLAAKAGYKGKFDSITEAQLTTYESSKASLTYEEYKALLEVQQGQ